LSQERGSALQVHADTRASTARLGAAARSPQVSHRQGWGPLVEKGQGVAVGSGLGAPQVAAEPGVGAKHAVWAGGVGGRGLGWL